MKGKEKCTLLKSIRCKIARENGIDYRPTECTFQGDCKGTCPKCEAELQKLTNDIEKLKNAGKRVAVAGIAAAMVAGSASGCVPKPLDTELFQESQVDAGFLEAPEVEETKDPVDSPANQTEVEGKILEELAGEIPAPEEEYVLDGDIALPEDLIDE